MTTYTNKFFLYEGSIVIAAQPTFKGAMRYFKKGIEMFNGSPERHKTNITNIAVKFLELKSL